MSMRKLPVVTMSPISKIVHLLLIGATFYLLPTGIRLLRFNHLHTDSFAGRMLDALSGSGNVLAGHISAGMILLAVTAFYLVYQLLSGEIARFFVRSDYGPLRSTLYAIILLSLVAVCVSGYCLARDATGFLRYGDLVGIHRLAVGMLLICGIVHIFHVSVSRRSKVLTTVWSHGGISGGQMLAGLLSLLLSSGAYLLLSRSNRYASTLVCHSQNRPVFVDGKESDIEWLGVNEAQVHLHDGANYRGGETSISVKTIRDNHAIYFLLQWEDATRSLNKHLVKTEGGWQEVRSKERSAVGDTVYSEDQLAIMFSRKPEGCLAKCHLLPIPGIGRHYSDGDTTDLWWWKAVSSNPVGQAIDGYISADLDSSGSGVHFENAAGGGFHSNLDTLWRQPYFLPKYYFIRDWINIMTDSYEPYAESLDTFSIGSQIPAVAVAPMMGDIADLRTFGRWRGGKWTLEIARRNNTGSNFDVRLMDTLYMSLAAFNNAEKKHAYSLRPIRVIFER